MLPRFKGHSDMIALSCVHLSGTYKPLLTFRQPELTDPDLALSGSGKGSGYLGSERSEFKGFNYVNSARVSKTFCHIA